MVVDGLNCGWPVRRGRGACRGYCGFSLAAASLREENAGRRGLLLLCCQREGPSRTVHRNRDWTVPRLRCTGRAERGHRQVLALDLR